jgi:hypothetical protein
MMLWRVCGEAVWRREWLERAVMVRFADGV